MKVYRVEVDDNGDKRWFLNNELHREDGPAIELADGTKMWWLNNELLTKTEWRKQIQKIKSPCVDKVVEIDGVKYRLTAV